MSVGVSFAWYDLWIGAYVDREHHRLYVCLLPCLLVTIKWKPRGRQYMPGGEPKDCPCACGDAPDPGVKPEGGCWCVEDRR